MKREAITHTKMKRLCRRLDLAQWQGVGLLESLWHLAARETPRGNIGKLSDEDIALAIDYRGDEAELIGALVDSGWLDRDEAERLIVHDWSDHADDAVQMKVARSRGFFVGGRAPKISRLTGRERESAATFYQASAQSVNSCAEPRSQDPELCAGARPQGGDSCAQEAGWCPLPEPRQSPAPPEPRINRGEVEILSPFEAKLSEAARRIHERHPHIRRCGLKEVTDKLRAIAKQFPTSERIARLAEIDRVHSDWCASDQWQKDSGEFAKGLDNWLAPTKGRWAVERPETVRKMSKSEKSLAEASTLFSQMNPGYPQ